MNKYRKQLHWFSSVRAPACWHGSSSLPSASPQGGNRKINDLLENNWLNLCCSLSGGACASWLSASMQRNNSFRSSRSSFFICYKMLRLQSRRDADKNGCGRRETKTKAGKRMEKMARRANSSMKERRRRTDKRHLKLVKHSTIVTAALPGPFHGSCSS